MSIVSSEAEEDLPPPLLALSLDESRINKQPESILFQIPGEIRESIYHFVFTAEDERHPPDVPYDPNKSWPGNPKVHTELLRTCRAIYSEACLLPVSLNPAFAFQGTIESRDNVFDVSGGRFYKLTPWQFAALSSLVITVQQFRLDGGYSDLRRHAKDICAAERAAGMYLAHYSEVDSSDEDEPPESFLYDAVPFPDMPWVGRTSLPPSNDPKNPFYRASAIKHLTIRLDCADWWTWEDGPDNPMAGLALDPSLGDGSFNGRPTPPQMLEAAKERRERRDRGESAAPYPRKSWGRGIGLFKGLRGLTLHLEMFADRAGELDRLIECAKLWTFPVDSDNNPESSATAEEKTGRVLKWDGHVEGYRWGQELPPDEENGFHELEVRIISWS